MSSRLDRASNIRKQYNLKNVFILSSIEELDDRLFVKEFDAVLFIDVLEHCKDVLVVLRNASDFLKKDGLLIINTPAFGQNRFFLKKERETFMYGDDKHYFEGFLKTDLENILSDLGFHVMESRFVFFYLYQIAWEFSELIREHRFFYRFTHLPLRTLGLLDRFIKIGKSGNGIFIIASKK